MLSSLSPAFGVLLMTVQANTKYSPLSRILFDNLLESHMISILSNFICPQWFITVMNNVYKEDILNAHTNIAILNESSLIRVW